jgi:hypothetical protein
VRACYAALAMQEAMRRYTEEVRHTHGVEMQLRVGLNSGAVVVRALVETGVLTGDRGAYRLVKPLDTLQVPATVQALLAARIDRLPPEDKRLLQTAAVIGTEVPWPLLQAIADTSDEALYRGLAQHALRDEVWEKALAYGRQAGDKARTRSAYREAVVCFEQALVALEHLPDSRAVTEQAIDLRLGLRAAPRPWPRRSATHCGSGGSTSAWAAISGWWARWTMPSTMASAPSPWPRSWACAPSRPTATAAWGCCTPGQVSRNRPVQRSRRRSSCTARWT